MYELGVVKRLQGELQPAAVLLAESVTLGERLAVYAPSTHTVTVFFENL